MNHARTAYFDFAEKLKNRKEKVSANLDSAPSAPESSWGEKLYRVIVSGLDLVGMLAPPFQPIFIYT